MPARVVDQSTRLVHHQARSGSSVVLVPDRFERRCRPRMSPNGHFVIRVSAVISHRPPNVRFFTGLHSYLILPPDAHYASLQHLLLGQLLKSSPPFSSHSSFVLPSSSSIYTRRGAFHISHLSSPSCDAIRKICELAGGQSITTLPVVEDFSTQKPIL